MAWFPSFFIPHKEEVHLFVLRKHWIELAFIALIATLFSALPFIAFFLLQALGARISDAPFVRVLFTLGGSGYALMLVLFVAYAFVDYWLDLWVVTNRRILHIEQKGLFHREVAELELSRIQDLTSETQGIVATLLGYGTLSVQTAGEEPRFVFHDIPHPDSVRAVIMNALKEARGAEHLGG